MEHQVGSIIFLLAVDVILLIVKFRDTLFSKTVRSRPLQTKKFVLVPAVWNKFMENS